MTHPPSHEGQVVLSLWKGVVRRPSCPARVEPSMHEVARHVAQLHGLTLDQLRSSGPTRRLSARHVSRIRQWAMWQMRRQTGASYTAIGLFFDRNHTTVMHGCRVIEERMK